MADSWNKIDKSIFNKDIFKTRKEAKKLSYKTRERKPKTFSTPLWNLKFIIQEHIGKKS